MIRRELLTEFYPKGCTVNFHRLPFESRNYESMSFSGTISKGSHNVFIFTKHEGETTVHIEKLDDTQETSELFKEFLKLHTGELKYVLMKYALMYHSRYMVNRDRAENTLVQLKPDDGSANLFMPFEIVPGVYTRERKKEIEEMFGEQLDWIANEEYDVFNGIKSPAFRDVVELKKKTGSIRPDTTVIDSIIGESAPATQEASVSSSKGIFESKFAIGDEVVFMLSSPSTIIAKGVVKAVYFSEGASPKYRVEAVVGNEVVKKDIASELAFDTPESLMDMYIGLYRKNYEDE